MWSELRHIANYLMSLLTWIAISVLTRLLSIWWCHHFTLYLSKVVKSLSSKQPFKNSCKLISPSLFVSRRLKMYSTLSAASFWIFPFVSVIKTSGKNDLVVSFHGDSSPQNFQHFFGGNCPRFVFVINLESPSKFFCDWPFLFKFCQFNELL